MRIHGFYILTWKLCHSAQCMSLLRLISWLKPVNDVLVVAFSIHGKRARIPAVTITIIGRIRFVNLCFVVVDNNWFDITHASLAQFECVPVENFVKRIWFRKVLINKRKEALSYIQYDILDEAQIVLTNVSWTFPSWSLSVVWIFVWQPLLVSASWYTGLALTKHSWSEDIPEQSLLIESRMLFRIGGGDLDFLCT